ncbi:Uncharacterised protein [Salmonella enterica]|uniref:Uncharacterized protein n=1 Tax=Salmonella enterica TaxID=28901 RepID=A0A379QFA5_SALER|nr:Uncharacterised protein [Salmonella enterica]
MVPNKFRQVQEDRGGRFSIILSAGCTVCMIVSFTGWFVDHETVHTCSLWYRENMWRQNTTERSWQT